MPCVAFVNASKYLSDEDADVIVEALRQHAAEDFGPLWPALDLPLPIFVGKDEKNLPADAYPMIFTDRTDVPGATAYHSVDPNGRYFGHVFVDYILARGGTTFGGYSAFPHSVSVAAGHEYDELVGDPTCDRYVIGPRLPEGSRYAVELVDPVQGDFYFKTIQRNGKSYQVACPDVVGPAWFEAGSGPLSFLRKPPAPWVPAPGGYMDIASDRGVDTFVFAERDDAAAAAVKEKVGLGKASRLGRRRLSGVNVCRVSPNGDIYRV